MAIPKHDNKIIMLKKGYNSNSNSNILNMYVCVYLYVCKYNAYIQRKYLSSNPLMEMSSSSSQTHLYRDSTGRSNGYSKAFETNFNDLEISEILLLYKKEVIIIT